MLPASCFRAAVTITLCLATLPPTSAHPVTREARRIPTLGPKKDSLAMGDDDNRPLPLYADDITSTSSSPKSVEVVSLLPGPVIQRREAHYADLVTHKQPWKASDPTKLIPHEVQSFVGQFNDYVGNKSNISVSDRIPTDFDIWIMAHWETIEKLETTFTRTLWVITYISPVLLPLRAGPLDDAMEPRLHEHYKAELIRNAVAKHEAAIRKQVQAEKAAEDAAKIKKTAEQVKHTIEDKAAADAQKAIDKAETDAQAAEAKAQQEHNQEAEVKAEKHAQAVKEKALEEQDKQDQKAEKDAVKKEKDADKQAIGAEKQSSDAFKKAEQAQMAVEKMKATDALFQRKLEQEEESKAQKEADRKLEKGPEGRA